MASSFGKLSPLLDDIWLALALRDAYAEVGGLAESDVRKALRATFDACTRRMPIPYGQRGHVGWPREFAAGTLKAELLRRKNPWTR